MSKKFISILAVIFASALVLVAYLYYSATLKDSKLAEVIDFSKKGESYIIAQGNGYYLQTKKCLADVTDPNVWCSNTISKAPSDLAPFAGKKVNFEGHYDNDHHVVLTKIELAK